MPLMFPKQIRGWDLRRNIVNFLGEDSGNPRPCAISMEALIDHFGPGRGSKQSCLAAFDKWRTAIQQKASDKYDVQDQKNIDSFTHVGFPLASHRQRAWRRLRAVKTARLQATLERPILSKLDSTNHWPFALCE